MIDPLGIKAYLAMGKLIGLLILIALVCYQSSQIHKWHKQADGLSAKLEAISTRKNEQGIATGKNIVTAKRKGEDADRVARKIEAATLPGLCKTPSEVLSADI